MSSPSAHAVAADGISVERRFGWGVETIAAAIIWGGLLGVVAPGPHEDPRIAAGIMAAGLVLLGFRLVLRRNRVRVIAYPERNEAEIFTNGKLTKRVPFTSLAVVIQNGANTFGPAFALAAFTFVFLALAGPGGAPSGLLQVFAGGAAVLCVVMLATHLRTRLLHRRLVLPHIEILVPKPEGQQIARELALFTLRHMAVSHPHSAGWSTSLSRSLVMIGNERAARGHPVGALAAYEESLAIDRAAFAADPSKVQLQEHIRKSTDRIAEMRRRMGAA